MIDGQRIAFRQAGQGPALVLLHGITCDSRAWLPQLDGLADRFRVIAWDAPGAGASTDPPMPYTLTDWANHLAGLMSSLDIARAHVVGVSWGGLVAQEFQRLHHARVGGLVLAGTYAGWKGSLSTAICEERLRRCRVEADLPPDEFAARWVPELLSPAAPPRLREEMAVMVREFHPAGFRLMGESLAAADTRGLLADLSMPTLLLWGEKDQRSALSIAAQFRSLIAHAELKVLPNAGHVSNMEQPEEFNASVRRFCLAHPMAAGEVM